MGTQPKSTAAAPATAKPVDEAASATPEESAEKVARLRALIEKGEYHVDLDLLARRIVEDG